MYQQIITIIQVVEVHIKYKCKNNWNPVPSESQTIHVSTATLQPNAECANYAKHNHSLGCTFTKAFINLFSQPGLCLYWMSCQTPCAEEQHLALITDTGLFCRCLPAAGVCVHVSGEQADGHKKSVWLSLCEWQNGQKSPILCVLTNAYIYALVMAWHLSLKDWIFVWCLSWLLRDLLCRTSHRSLWGALSDPWGTDVKLWSTHDGHTLYWSNLVIFKTITFDYVSILTVEWHFLYYALVLSRGPQKQNKNVRMKTGLGKLLFVLSVITVSCLCQNWSRHQLLTLQGEADSRQTGFCTLT